MATPCTLNSHQVNESSNRCAFSIVAGRTGILQWLSVAGLFFPTNAAYVNVYSATDTMIMAMEFRPNLWFRNRPISGKHKLLFSNENTDRREETSLRLFELVGEVSLFLFFLDSFLVQAAIQIAYLSAHRRIRNRNRIQFELGLLTSAIRWGIKMKPYIHILLLVIIFIL